MDKLRKIGLWFWYNKERMVLLVMLVVLAYRVYGVLYPGDAPVWKNIPVPQTSLPESAEERQTLGLPGELPYPLAGLPGCIRRCTSVILSGIILGRTTTRFR